MNLRGLLGGLRGLTGRPGIGAGTCDGCRREYPDPLPGPELAGRVLYRVLHAVRACDLARETPCARCGVPAPARDVGGATAEREPLCDVCAIAVDRDRGSGGRAS